METLDRLVEDPNVGSDYLERYIERASGARGDTTIDRVLEVYTAMRVAAPNEGWHRVPGLRSFSQKYAEFNPYIPPNIRHAWEQSAATPAVGSGFLESWIDGGNIRIEYPIDPLDLLRTVESDPEIADRFVKQNLHSAAYFFTKFTEWHISCDYILDRHPDIVVDLGAAYQGFARVATKADENVVVEMVDLGFPPGRSEFAPRIARVGADAGSLHELYEDDSVDLVVSHNAFEHFILDADRRAVREISRILRPGGTALITPFFVSRHHTVSVNPFVCYVVAEDSFLADAIDFEVAEMDARVAFNSQMISPYARAYSYESAQERLLSAIPDLKVRILIVDFTDKASIPSQDFEYQGVPLGRDIFHQPEFLVLEITKPQ